MAARAESPFGSGTAGTPAPIDMPYRPTWRRHAARGHRGTYTPPEGARLVPRHAPGRPDERATDVHMATLRRGRLAEGVSALARTMKEDAQWRQSAEAVAGPRWSKYVDPKRVVVAIVFDDAFYDDE